LVVEVAAKRLGGEIGAQVHQHARRRVHVVVARIERRPRADSRADDGDGLGKGGCHRGRHYARIAVDRRLDSQAPVAQPEKHPAYSPEQQLGRESEPFLQDRRRRAGFAGARAGTVEAVAQVYVAEEAVDPQLVAAQARRLRRAPTPQLPLDVTPAAIAVLESGVPGAR
jgi:hypothetical protein